MKDINRFVLAQDSCYQDVLQEIKQGKKQTHWMWFIFPQIQGLGRSHMSEMYAIQNIAEAKQYLQNNLLAERFIELTTILAEYPEPITAEEIFGFIDKKKFWSSLTLFLTVIEQYPEININEKFNCIANCLKRYFDGFHDKRTSEILNSLEN